VCNRYPRPDIKSPAPQVVNVATPQAAKLSITGVGIRSRDAA